MTPEHAPSSGPSPAAQGMSRLNPGALSVADAARVLTRIGGVGGKPVTEELLRADIDAGAPTNADGTLNLVHYAAWLVKEMAASGGSGGN
ncbi:MAG: hypothetical protein HBSAPP03_02610 [Phycisphaerae bacterium]|nr:MAG: hypothetical protein HBSAPP03_02610 [Phycisphaerae bacterium]